MAPNRTLGEFHMSSEPLMEMSISPEHSDDSKPSSLKIVIAASAAGTVFEWYDFFIFGTLTPTISRVFFSDLSLTGSYLAALGLFGVGFACRPLGALLFGHLGDTAGRKSVFLAALVLMGLSTVGIGILPTQQQAGLLAPALLIILRVMQGFALGGEFGGAAVYVAEHAGAHNRGFFTSFVQASAGAALALALVVILGSRALASLWGPNAFEDWGWRIPFLGSAGLLVVALLIRMRLAESPTFARAKMQGAIAKAPYAEVFGRKDNLTRVILALVALIAGQTCSWYTTFFYSLTFMEKSLKLEAGAAGWLAMGSAIASIPLYLFFGWLSDRIGRKRVLASGLCMAAICYFPAFHLLTDALNPKLTTAIARHDVHLIVSSDNCTFQFYPFGKNELRTACDIAKQALADSGTPYTTNTGAASNTDARIAVGQEQIRIPDIQGQAAPQTKQIQDRTAKDLAAALRKAGFPDRAAPDTSMMIAAFAILLVLVVAAAAVYGPMTACLVELFPTRIRYTALSVPYHLGTGWIGGFLPLVSFALVVWTGNIYAGLWYPFGFTLLSALTCLLFLPETSGDDLAD